MRAKRKHPAWDRFGSKPGVLSFFPIGACAQYRVPLTISIAGPFRGCNTLPAQCFALFATSEFAWFLVAFFKLQAFEKAVVLNFLFQNTHGFFKVVVDNPYFNCLQAFTPPSFHLGFAWSVAELSRAVVILKHKRRLLPDTDGFGKGKYMDGPRDLKRVLPAGITGGRRADNCVDKVPGFDSNLIFLRVVQPLSNRIRDTN